MMELVVTVTMLMQVITSAAQQDGKPTQMFLAPSPSCNRVYHNLSGAVIESDDVTRRAPDACDIRFVTTDRWLVHVDHIVMPKCPVSVFLYDSDIGAPPNTPTVNFTCGDETAIPTTLDMKTDFLTFRLINPYHNKIRFKLVLTAYKEPWMCPPEFRCASGTCIPRSLLCDGVDNCLDGIDELVEIAELPNGTEPCFDRKGCQYFRCASDSMCVPGQFLCDAVKDCQDGSDEEPEGRSMCLVKKFDTSSLIVIGVIVGVCFAVIGLGIIMAVIWRTKPEMVRRLSFRRQSSKR